MTTRLEIVSSKLQKLERYEEALHVEKSSLSMKLDRLLNIELFGTSGFAGARGMPGSLDPEPNEAHVYAELSTRATSVCKSIDRLRTDIANLKVLISVAELISRYPTEEIVK